MSGRDGRFKVVVAVFIVCERANIKIAERGV